ncbi:MAG: hypothetical protein ACOYN0_00685 [Phycisphaerales bacterium]
MKSIRVVGLLGLLLSVVGEASAQVSTAFTYQGRFQRDGVVVTGAHDIEFRLFDQALGGGQVGATMCVDDVPLVAGEFSVLLDFGDQFSAGRRLFLQISTRDDGSAPCSGGSPFVPLLPRQEVTLAPFAGYALNARIAETALSAGNSTSLGGQDASFYRNAANMNAGVLPDIRLSPNVPRLNAAAAFTGAITMSNPANVLAGSGSGLIDLNASNLTSGTLPGQALSGQYFNTVNLSNTNNVLVGQHSGNGSGLTNLNVSNVSLGVLSPLRGGTGSVVNNANVGDVLKWNGANFTAQPDANTTYVAGAGLSLVGTTFQINPGQINGGMIAANTVSSANIGDGAVAAVDLAINSVNSTHLALDAASMLRVSGGAVTVSGGNLGIGIAPDTDRLSVNGTASISGATTITGNVGIGGAPTTSKLNVVGGANVTGPMTAGSFAAPSEARSLFLSAADFTGTATAVLDDSGLNQTNLHLVTCGSSVQSTFALAPVHLPHGAVVTSMTIFVIDGSVLTNVSVNLLRRTPTNVDPGGTVASVSSSGSDSSIRSFVDSTISGATINNDTSMYYVSATFPPGASLYIDNPNLTGVRINYTTTTPAH